MKILVVEDDRALSGMLVRMLQDSGFVCDAVYDGETAHERGCTEFYDAAVLDLGLPELDGISVLQGWRDGGCAMPVLILTARNRWSEKLAGFNAGADDYVTKPFEAAEVALRLNALIRRSAGHAKAILETGGLVLDTLSRRVTDGGKPLKLSALEFRILCYLLHYPGRVVSRTEFLEHVYDSNGDPDSNVIDVIIGRLRKKLTNARITTVRGQGFRLDTLEHDALDSENAQP